MNLNEELNTLYEIFFNKLNVDTKTGIKSGTNKRFAAKIAIGENYYGCKKKILFVSFDIGRDEKFVETGINTFQDLEERKNAVCCGNLKKKNPHMAGVYGTALFFLKDVYSWQKEWDILGKSDQYFKETLIANCSYLPDNVLTFISLVNFYNFVTVGRKDRTGDSDRNFIDQISEFQLLVDIINTIKPSIIVVQSKSLKSYFISNIKPRISSDIDIYVGFHPSIFGRGIRYRNPNLYMENLIEKSRI